MSKGLLEHSCNVKGWIYLTAAHGGVNGRVVQITTQTENTGYCVMTFAEAKKVLSKMRRSITELEKQYNENPPWWERMQKNE